MCSICSYCLEIKFFFLFMPGFNINLHLDKEQGFCFLNEAESVGMRNSSVVKIDEVVTVDKYRHVQKGSVSICCIVKIPMQCQWPCRHS